MSRKAALLVGVNLGATLAIGYLNLRTDEVTVVLGAVLIASFGLGLAQPELPWRWALLAGVAVPASAALALALQITVPYANGMGNIVNSFVAIVPAFLGAYAAAGIRAVTDDTAGV